MTRWQTWAFYLLRAGFGLMLMIASVDKLLHPVAFARVIENYRVVGESLATWAAVWLPWLELMLGLFLLSGFWLFAVSVWNSVLMTAFFVMVLQAFVRHLDIACGCFSIGEEGNIHWLKLMENTGLMAASLLFVWLAWLHERMRKKKIRN